MKKHRKQIVNVLGQRQLVDVPVDDELYKADNRDKYLRVKSMAKHVSLDVVILADESTGVAETYEEDQLTKCLHDAVNALCEKERRLVEYLYFDALTEREAAAILGISQQAVSKQKHRIIAKLRNNLIDWM